MTNMLLLMNTVMRLVKRSLFVTMILDYGYIYVQALHTSVTRENNFKLVLLYCKYDLRK